MEFNEFEERMEKTISVFEENLSEIRAELIAAINSDVIDINGIITNII